MKGFSKHTYFIIGVFILACFSFTQFAPIFFNRYTSDSAIHVLMAHRFKFPNDLYFWGQDRLGSFLPMVASIPVKLFGFSPIWCVSVVQYLLLLFGFLFFSPVIKNYFLKILFCIFWFFPLHLFDWHLQIGQPYSAQLFFLGLSLYLLLKIDLQEIKKHKNKWRIVGSGLSFMLSIWVSDLSAFILPVYFLFVATVFCSANQTNNKINLAINLQAFYKLVLWLILGLIAGYLFIELAKSNIVYHDPQYDILFSPISHIKLAFGIIFENIMRAFSFELRDILISFHSIFIVLVLLLLLINLIKNKGFINVGFALKSFFFFSTLITFVLVTSSHWVEINGYDLRFFTFTYFLLFIYLFISVDQINSRILSKLGHLFLTIVVLTGSLNVVILGQVKDDNPRYLNANEIKVLSDKLGRCGLIGDYWTSHNLSSIEPDNIKASTYDINAPRDTRIIADLMKEKTIYFVGNNWLNTFPPSKNVLGYFLEKSGEPFNINRLEFCRYKVVNQLELDVRIFSSRNSRVISHKNGKSYLMKNDSTSTIEDFLLFGPMLTLRQGNYKISCEVSSQSKLGTNDSLQIDITHDYGRTFIAKKTYQLNGNVSFDKNLNFKFDIDSLTRDVELRVFLKGKAQIKIQNIKLERKSLK